jgi:hypothetical protein
VCGVCDNEAIKAKRTALNDMATFHDAVFHSESQPSKEWFAVRKSVYWDSVARFRYKETINRDAKVFVRK